jgi:ferredoxin
VQTGPRAEGGFDLGLTEMITDDRHYFTVEVGSEAGAEVLAEIAHRPAEPGELETARAITDRAAGRMRRRLETAGLERFLQDNLEHPRWDHVAARCLDCGNCTLACPTCFCTTTEDVTDLTGDHAERRRRWDSCFTVDFSYIHGGSVRTSTKSRYRQWLTHKLSTWHEQFGTSGCVGCGRCITWCPAGIDLTEEVAAMRAHPTEGASA